MKVERAVAPSRPGFGQIRPSRGRAGWRINMRRPTRRYAPQDHSTGLMKFSSDGPRSVNDTCTTPRDPAGNPAQLGSGFAEVKQTAYSRTQHYDRSPVTGRDVRR